MKIELVVPTEKVEEVIDLISKLLRQEKLVMEKFL